MKQEGNSLQKLKELVKFVKYYKNFSRGVASGKIYHQFKVQNPQIIELIDQLKPEDMELIDKLFKKDIQNFLGNKKLKSHLDFDKKIGLDQIGYNTMYVDKPITGLWTTGKATFFIPTKKESRNKVSIEFQSIAPIQVTIGFEKKDVKNFNMVKLATKKVYFVIEQTQIKNKVSEISISTDKLWLPSVVLGVDDSVKLGVSLKSIDVSYL